MLCIFVFILILSRYHVKLATKYRLPLYLHIRNAHEDFINILTEEKYIDNCSFSSPIDMPMVYTTLSSVCFATSTSNNDTHTNNNDTHTNNNDTHTNNNDTHTNNNATNSFVEDISKLHISDCNSNIPISISAIPGVIHCFTGTFDELCIYLDMGFYIGITGFIMNCPLDKELNAHKADMKQILLQIGLNKLLIETDSPYMGFIGCRVSENENQSIGLKAAQKKKNLTQKYPNIPAALPLIVDYIHELTSWSAEDIVYNTTVNAMKLFQIPNE